MTTPDDARFMARAIELARLAPFTAPNPRVGAVVVKQGEIVGEGSHRGAGTPHAEADALEGADAAGGTLYVNLEPCNHEGRTPACAPAIVAAGVARVVAAIEDPDPRVRGSGLAHLRANGVEVATGVLADEARRLNEAFLHRAGTGRTMLSLKLALSLDGRLAAADGSARWITGPETRRHVHARRLEADAVMVGAGTIVADDPLLTVRDVEAPRQPARIVVDARGRAPAAARVFEREGTIVVTTEAATHEVRTCWKEAGAEVVTLAASPEGVDLSGLQGLFASRGWTEVLCEGGAGLARSLLREGLVDRLEVHYGPMLLGGGPSLTDLGVSAMAEARLWRTVEVRRSGDDALVTLLRTED
jgi:diaminohydroxyphosphoribosylaminopyrimidine deaminase/5-amino-6-(5-phosphoribosylamino)uracil reductase